MTYCEGCQELEGKTYEDEESGEILCAECDEIISRVPEHDDYEMER